jgi:heme-degrading monooxygenase HmoA
MMIARSWTACATREGADAYVGYFRETLAPVLARIPGYLGAEILEGRRGDLVELVVTTRWSSLEAIREFAGEDHERAVVEPEARALLVDFDERVQHRSVVLDAIP